MQVPSGAQLSETQRERIRKLIRPHLAPPDARHRQNEVIDLLEAARAKYLGICEERRAGKSVAGRRPWRRIRDRLGQVRTSASKLKKLLERLPAKPNTLGSEVETFENVFSIARLDAGQAQQYLYSMISGSTAPSPPNSGSLLEMLQMLEKIEVAVDVTLALAGRNHRTGAPHSPKRVLSALSACVLHGYGLPDRLCKRIVRILLEK